MSLNNFITHIKTVGALIGNKFEFIAPFVEGSSNSSAQTVSMLCSNVSAPGLALMTNDIRYFGEITERPYGISYPPITLTFYLDNDVAPKRYFEEWLGMVFNRDTRELNYYDQYTRDAEIIIYNKEESEVERIKLYECYPKSISDINLDYSQQGVSLLTIQLIYKWWSSTTTENIKELKGNSNTSEPLNVSDVFGFEGLGDDIEGLGNFTEKTFGGFKNNTFNLPSFDGNDVDFIQKLGIDLSSNSFRDLTQAGNLFDLSNITSDIYDEVGGLLSQTTNELRGQFGNLGNQITSIGTNWVGNIAPNLNNISTVLNDLSVSTGKFDSLLQAVGAGNTGIGQHIGQIIQTSQTIQDISKNIDLAPYLNSLSGNFSSIQSSISNSIPIIKNSSTSMDRSAEVAINTASKVFGLGGTTFQSIAARSLK
jgi:hypothetical protein